jgi:hypothetical protein
VDLNIIRTLIQRSVVLSAAAQEAGGLEKVYRANIQIYGVCASHLFVGKAKLSVPPSGGLQ